jgi:glycosyltransferase involved in cell wall biosynthesis
MSRPLVSIVTPSYNQADFIEDTLDSVRAQRYDRVEHIVVDGGSDDGTLDVLEAYEDADDGTLEWVSEPDDGQSDAINKGFERADGEIVAWLNSDDVYFDVGVLDRVVDYFDRYPADVIYGDLAYIGVDSRVNAIDVRPDFDARKLPYRILIGQPATFFRRAVVEEEKLRVDLDFSMDYEYWLRLAQNYSFRHVADVLAGFRSYEAQKSQDRTAMAAELREVFADYSYPDRPAWTVAVENARIEVKRLGRAAATTYRLHRNPPELAFDGRLAPLPTMLANLGPSVDDAMKVWRRLRSRGRTG